MVTKEKNKIVKYIAEIENLKQQIGKKAIEPEDRNRIQKLIKENQELAKANKALMQDNKDLKNIIDAIKFKFAVETKHLLKLENSEIKKGLIKLLKTTLG